MVNYSNLNLQKNFLEDQNNNVNNIIKFFLLLLFFSGLNFLSANAYKSGKNIKIKKKFEI